MKKKSGIIIGSIVGVLALGAAVFFGFSYIKTAILKLVMPDEKYVQYVLKEDSAKLYDFLGDTLENSVLSFDKENPYNVFSNKTEISLGESGKKMLTSFGEDYDLDLSWIEKVSIDNTGTLVENDIMDTIDINLNDKDLLSINTYMVPDKSSEYFSIPEISDKYIQVEEEELGEILDQYTALMDLIAVLPQSDETVELMQRYTDIAIEQINRTTAGERDITVDSVSVNCDSYTIPVTEELENKILLAQLKKLKSDSDVKKILVDFGDTASECSDLFKDSEIDFMAEYNDGKELYEGFAAKIDELIEGCEDLETDDETTDGKLTVFVDKKGNVAGYEFITADKEKVKIYKPRKGKKLGVLVSAETLSDKYKFKGIAQLNKTNLEGDFVFSANDQKIVDFTLKNMPVINTDHHFKGDVIIALDKDYEPKFEKANVVLDVLKEAKLKYNFDIAKEETNNSIILATDDGTLGGIKSTVTYAVNNDVEVPNIHDACNINDESDIMDYLESLSAEELIDNLKAANCPNEYVDMLQKYQDAIDEYGIMGLILMRAMGDDRSGLGGGYGADLGGYGSGLGGGYGADFGGGYGSGLDGGYGAGEYLGESDGLESDLGLDAGDELE